MKRVNQNSSARLRLAARRRRVAELTSGGATQRAVALALGMSQPTVSRDLSAVVGEDRDAARDALAALRERDARALEDMERNAVERFERADDDGARVKWGDHRLKIHSRRASLLGLDAPSRSAVVAHVGIENAPVDFMGDSGEQAVARMLDALDAVGIAGDAAGAILTALGVAVEDIPYARKLLARRDDDGDPLAAGKLTFEFNGSERRRPDAVEIGVEPVEPDGDALDGGATT